MVLVGQNDNRPKRVPRESQDHPLGGNGKLKMENGKLFLALALGTIVTIR